MTDMTKIEASFPNGAVILRGVDARGRLRFEIHYGEGGSPVRMLRDRTEAIEFAKSLPVPEGLEPVVPPAPISVSPRAHARRAELGIDMYQPVPEPNDGAASRPMSPARSRSGSGPSDRVVGVAVRPREKT
jgi:hypothetical protein